jgi:hypothetical protein
MKLSRREVEVNLAKIKDEKKISKLLIPTSYLTAIQKRGQDGKPVLRGLGAAKGK